MLPRTGTPNQKCPIARTSNIFKNANNTYGIILPRISSQDRIGVTISCSIVPRSRSRTIDVAVRMEVNVNKIIAITPGIM